MGHKFGLYSLANIFWFRACFTSPPPDNSNEDRRRGLWLLRGATGATDQTRKLMLSRGGKGDGQAFLQKRFLWPSSWFLGAGQGMSKGLLLMSPQPTTRICIAFERLSCGCFL